jgi:uncharacterized protein (TIGR02145 family)
MKNLIKLICLGFLIFSNILHSCKKEEVPTLTTSDIIIITPISAISGGTIADEGSSTIIARGVCWRAGLTPDVWSSRKTTDAPGGSDNYVSLITGLAGNTQYFVRAYATNNNGTGYGQQIQFTTTVDRTGQSGTVNDIDGNTYQTIGIGGQVWMAENLRTTKFNDGNSMYEATGATIWQFLTGPGYCWYDNDSTTYKDTYGALYNWYAVDPASNGYKNVCPTGWHVPTNNEWYILDEYLVNNGYGYLGSGYEIAKSMAATTDWLSDPTEGNVGNDLINNNSSGFTALPSGERTYLYPVVFYGSRLTAGWWSATEYDATTARSLYLQNSENYLGISYWNEKKVGLSVRCIKD